MLTDIFWKMPAIYSICWLRTNYIYILYYIYINTVHWFWRHGPGDASTEKTDEKRQFHGHVWLLHRSFGNNSKAKILRFCPRILDDLTQFDKMPRQLGFTYTNKHPKHQPVCGMCFHLSVLQFKQRFGTTKNTEPSEYFCEILWTLGWLRLRVWNENM